MGTERPGHILFSNEIWWVRIIYSIPLFRVNILLAFDSWLSQRYFCPLYCQSHCRVQMIHFLIIFANLTMNCITLIHWNSWFLKFEFWICHRSIYSTSKGFQREKWSWILKRVRSILTPQFLRPNYSNSSEFFTTSQNLFSLSGSRQDQTRKKSGKIQEVQKHWQPDFNVMVL